VKNSPFFEVKYSEKLHWLRNASVSLEIYRLPFAQQILRALARDTLVLLIDGTVVRRGCMALVIAVVYKQRALPIAWLVDKKKKGHFSEERHLELIQSVRGMIPDAPRIVLLGDGEFDGVDLQSVVMAIGTMFCAPLKPTPSVWQTTGSLSKRRSHM